MTIPEAFSSAIAQRTLLFQTNSRVIPSRDKNLPNLALNNLYVGLSHQQSLYISRIKANGLKN